MLDVNLSELDGICRHCAMSYQVDFIEAESCYSATTSSASPDDFFEVKRAGSPQAAVNELVRKLRASGRIVPPVHANTPISRVLRMRIDPEATEIDYHVVYYQAKELSKRRHCLKKYKDLRSVFGQSEMEVVALEDEWATLTKKMELVGWSLAYAHHRGPRWIRRSL